MSDVAHIMQVGPIAQAVPDGASPARPWVSEATAAPESSRRPTLLGWLAQLGLDAGLVALAVAAVIAQPPLAECRARAAIGFYAGDTFGKCLSSGIGARVNRLDQRLTMIALGSGR